MPYIGAKMSERAYEAYQNGEMPYTKWTKDDILNNLPAEIEEQVRKYPVEVLKRYFLTCSSWHHTGSYYNNTNFYSINEDVIDEFNIERLNELHDFYKEERAEVREKAKLKKVTSTARKCSVKYGVWCGTRKHPTLNWESDFGIIIGDWCYLKDGSKKKTSGKYFKIVKEYARVPKGTAEIFKKIGKYVK